MNGGNFFLRGLFAFLITINLFTAAHAEIQTYEGNGEYLMTDENLGFAKNQAEQLAWRKILEQVCVYVKEEGLMIDNELVEDEIITISEGIMYPIDTKFSMTEEDVGFSVKSFVTAQIDTDELKKLLEHAIKESVPNY